MAFSVIRIGIMKMLLPRSGRACTMVFDLCTYLSSLFISSLICFQYLPIRPPPHTGFCVLTPLGTTIFAALCAVF